MWDKAWKIISFSSNKIHRIYPVMHVLEIFKLNISDNAVDWKLKH